MQVAHIDADSLIYIISWHHKDTEELDDYFVLQACDSIFHEIMSRTGCREYYGFFSGENNFRQEVYKYAAYKGHRPEKAEWVKKWEPVIKNHFKTVWGFYEVLGIEADDCIALTTRKYRPEDIVICSPDKDMKQLSGYHFDYKAMDSEIVFVTQEQADHNFCMQMLTGDAVDNVAGIPGLGEVKAEKLLKDLEILDAMATIDAQYKKAFGEYYGPIIQEQTYKVLRLLCLGHPCLTVDVEAQVKFLTAKELPQEELPILTD